MGKAIAVRRLMDVFTADGISNEIAVGYVDKATSIQRRTCSALMTFPTGPISDRPALRTNEGGNPHYGNIRSETHSIATVF